MYVLGSPGSTVNVTIIDSTITTCSAVAQTTLAVSARHAAQQGEGSRVLGGDRGDSTAARACAFDWWGGARASCRLHIHACGAMHANTSKRKVGKR